MENLHGFLLTGLILCVGIGLVACGSSDTKQDARVKVSMTDAPGDYEQVPITVCKVQIAKEEQGEESEADERQNGNGAGGRFDGKCGAGGGAGWTTLVDESQDLDLLELQDGVEAALGEEDIPEGEYRQIRLILSKAEVVVDGETHELFVPSGKQTGFKLNHDFDVEGGNTYELLLDFDAAESIKSNGRGYMLTPVLKVERFEIGQQQEE